MATTVVVRTTAFVGKTAYSARLSFSLNSSTLTPKPTAEEAVSITPVCENPKPPQEMSVTKSEVEHIKQQIDKLSTKECKTRLTYILSNMEGKKEEWLEIEAIINSLESKYEPMLTLDFYNLALQGKWHFMFSTSNTLTNPPWGVLRVREITQTVLPGGFGTLRADPSDYPTTKFPIGNYTNEIIWDFSNEENGNFDCTGKLLVKCCYEINQGARLNVQLDEHILNPGGKTLPKDPSRLVGLLYNAIPTELFDPNQLGMDTTFLDVDLRIMRFTGDSKFEGVRNIFVRL